MRVKIYVEEKCGYSILNNVGRVKPYKNSYGDNYFMILFNGEEEGTEYSRKEYEIDKIMGDKYD